MCVYCGSMSIPDCIHAFVLSDELNELLDSKTELKTTLKNKQTKKTVSLNHKISLLDRKLNSSYISCTRYTIKLPLKILPSYHCDL